MTIAWKPNLKFCIIHKAPCNWDHTHFLHPPTEMDDETNSLTVWLQFKPRAVMFIHWQMDNENMCIYKAETVEYKWV